MSHGHAPVRDVPAATTPHPLLRVRDGSEAKVSYAELFFDLVYVFAVTQVSHFLLGHLTLLGAARRCCCGSRSGWAGSTPAG